MGVPLKPSNPPKSATDHVHMYLYTDYEFCLEKNKNLIRKSHTYILCSNRVLTTSYT